MKKFISIIILAAAAAACSDKIELAPALSLFNSTPEIGDDTAVFRLAVANLSDSTERVLPVTFGGSAQKGVDYEVSSDAFIIGGKSPLDSIVVTTLRFGTEKTVSITVELPEGMEGGKYMTSGYTLQDIPAFITFTQGYKLLADSTFVKFGLTDKNGKTKVLKRDTEIRLSVNTEKSTVVEGVDFEFADSSYYIIPKGGAEGRLKLKNLSPMVTEGNDKLVLSLIHDKMLGEGAYAEVEIDLADKVLSGLEGRWKIDTLVTDTTYMKSFWGGQCSGYDLLPEFDDRDELSFDTDLCLFKPGFMSGFNHYFLGTAEFRKGSKQSVELIDGTSVELQTFMIGNTNRDFSKDSKSEDTESVIGLRYLASEEEEVSDTLDLYVIDYVSKSFMPELETEGRYAAGKPTAASKGQFFNITFIR